MAPLYAAREHLPQDIVEILKLLGKADNIPFNQLYNLVQDCVDHCYTKVIKALTHLLNHNFTDRQTVLVRALRAVRALKFLESYGDRQAKLWKVLTKYDKLPDYFHYLQTTLQTEFAFLKKATSRNIDQFQEAINLQQTYTTSLCSHVTPFMQNWCNWRDKSKPIIFTPSQTDSVQINAPEYDSDIDSQIDTLPDLQLHAKNNQEEPTPTTGDSEDLEFSKDTNRTDLEPESIGETNPNPLSLPPPKQTLYRLMHQSMIRTLTVR